MNLQETIDELKRIKDEHIYAERQLEKLYSLPNQDYKKVESEKVDTNYKKVNSLAKNILLNFVYLKRVRSIFRDLICRLPFSSNYDSTDVWRARKELQSTGLGNNFLISLQKEDFNVSFDDFKSEYKYAGEPSGFLGKKIKIAYNDYNQKVLDLKRLLPSFEKSVKNAETIKREKLDAVHNSFYEKNKAEIEKYNEIINNVDKTILGNQVFYEHIDEMIKLLEAGVCSSLEDVKKYLMEKHRLELY